MNKNTKLTLVVFMLLINININAQIKRSGWYGMPVFHTDNPIHMIGVEYLKHLIVTNSINNESDIPSYLKYIIPGFRYRANLFQKLEFANGKARIHPKLWGFSHIDWKLRNYGIGYKFGYVPKNKHLGFEVEADYIQDGYEVRMPDNNYEVEQSITKRMFSGQLLLNYRFGNYVSQSSICQFKLELGGAYNYAFHYHDNEINDRDAVNNGFVGIIGLGFTLPKFNNDLSLGIRYEQPFYNFYNDEYIYNGQKIFAGSKSSFGRIYTQFNFSF